MSKRHVVNVEISVKNDDVEMALRRFSRKVRKLGVLDEHKKKLIFEKPSAKRNRIKQRLKKERRKEKK